LKKYLVTALILLLTGNGFSKTDSTLSLAFKRNRAIVQTTPVFTPPIALYDLYDGFLLVRQANAGDASAQHELGLRYLTGKGFLPDTVKSFYWVKKAAEQNLAIANFNMGIFYNNGWGCDWNPFEGFKYFKIAAEGGMPEAQYLVGLIYTENLVVIRNLSAAYKWINKAAEQNYTSAQITLTEMKKRGIKETGEEIIAETIEEKQKEKSVSLKYIDFTADTTSVVNDSTIVEDILKEGTSIFKENIGVKNLKDSLLFGDTSLIAVTKRAADAGSPEALIFLGRMFEKGLTVEKNQITAAQYYIRAIRLESIKAPMLLWDLINQKDFFVKLRSMTSLDNDDARYVWAALTSLKLDYRIAERDAIQLLNKAVEKKHIPSLMELALHNFRGTFIEQDVNKAYSLWNEAALQGSVEAEIRLLMGHIAQNRNHKINEDELVMLQNADSTGSIVAQLTLAYCYENGNGIQQNIAKAIEYYRKAAYRGSNSAYESMKRIYNAVRPDSEEFRIYYE
jgi:TPR repeat protein